MKKAIVVLPYIETSRLFTASKSVTQNAYLGLDNAVVFYQHQAAIFDKNEAIEIASKHPNINAFIKEIN